MQYDRSTSPWGCDERSPLDAVNDPDWHDGWQPVRRRSRPVGDAVLTGRSRPLTSISHSDALIRGDERRL